MPTATTASRSTASAGKRVVGAVARALPPRVADFLYRNRFHPLLRPGRRLMLRFLGPEDGVRVTRGPLAGHTLAFTDNLAMWMGLHEPEVQAELAGRLRPGQVAYDIGAHIGYMALVMAAQVGSEGRVIAYEPDPENAALLERTISLNDTGSVIDARPVALGAEEGAGSTRRFDQSGLAEVVVGDPGDGTAIEITTLDAEVFREGLPAPDLILVDTEGMEEAIFRGAERVLREAQPDIVCEHHDRQDVLIPMLAAYGYGCRVIDEGHLLFSTST